MTDFVGDPVSRCTTHFSCDCIQQALENHAAEIEKLQRDLIRAEALNAWYESALLRIEADDAPYPRAKARAALNRTEQERRWLESALGLEDGILG